MELVLLPLFEGTRSDGERGIVCRVICRDGSIMKHSV
jgi:hypothetical protein